MLGDRVAGGARLCRRACVDHPAAGSSNVRPRRLRLGAARCGRAGDAGIAKAARRAPPIIERGAARRGGARPDALHLHAGERLDGARRARDRQGRQQRRARCRRRAHARARSTAPSRASRSAASRCGSPTPGEGRCRRWSRCRGAPLPPEPAAERGFKIERLYYTLDGEAGRSVAGQAEPPLRGGAEDHRAAAAVRPRHCRRLSAGRI